MSNFSTRQLVPGEQVLYLMEHSTFPQVRLLEQRINENTGLLFYHALRLIRVLQIQRFVTAVLSLSTDTIFLIAYITISTVHQ